MKCFKNIKKIVLFLLMAFMCAGIGYSQSLLEIVKTVKETKESFKKVKSERNNITQKSLNNGESRKSESESLEHQNIVTLIVSADGSTKDEATKIALRSAIEQAYGTFVSANTTILNDELVKDEIVTVSSGNIVGYKEISCEQMPGGSFFVTLQATVSISKLISYAQSKGAETEFAGATFGMNMKMKELNKKNEEIALNNLVDQVIALYPSAFSYSLTVSEPKLIPGGGSVSYGEPGNSPRNVSLYMPDVWSTLGLPGTYEDYYVSTVAVGIEPNQQMKSIVELILTTVNSLALSREESKEYENLNLKTHASFIFHGSTLDKNKRNTIDSICDENKYMIYHNSTPRFEFRSNTFSLLSSKINNKIIRILNSFQIVDNLGNISKITSWKSCWANGNSVSLYAISGTNLLSAFANYSKEEKKERHPSTSELYYTNGRCVNLFDNSYFGNRIFFQAFILFPKDEISKYSNFKIEPVSVENIIIDDSDELLDIDNKFSR